MNTVSRRTFSLGAMSLALGTTLAACGTQSEEAVPTVTREDVAGAPPTRTATLPGDATPETTAPEATPAETGEAPAGGGSTAVELDMIDLAFEPTDLTIAADTDVTITLVNKGALTHAFAVPDQSITSDEISGGSTGSVVVNLPAGVYEFDCPIPGHKEAGMVGKLTVA